MIKKIYCKKCEGRGYIPHVETWDYDNGLGGGKAWYEHCTECNGSGLIEYHLTNADHIRQMTDEEIANVLLDWFCIGNQESYTRNRNEVYDDILKWLLSQSLI